MMNYKQEVYNAFSENIRKYYKNLSDENIFLLEHAFLCGYNMGTLEDKEEKYQRASIIKLKEN
jgi:CHAT domain-containing protein